jgi:hypothetical protein
MRHPLPLSQRLNWRLIGLLAVLLALCLTAAIYSGGGDETSTATALGPGWTCTPNLIGTVCVRDVTKTAAKAVNTSSLRTSH